MTKRSKATHVLERLLKDLTHNYRSLPKTPTRRRLVEEGLDILAAHRRKTGRETDDSNEESAQEPECRRDGTPRRAGEH
jgi:hypothetical protein